jgi:hypothetical protein
LADVGEGEATSKSLEAVAYAVFVFLSDLEIASPLCAYFTMNFPLKCWVSEVIVYA